SSASRADRTPRPGGTPHPDPTVRAGRPLRPWFGAASSWRAAPPGSRPDRRGQRRDPTSGLSVTLPRNHGSRRGVDDDLFQCRQHGTRWLQPHVRGTLHHLQIGFDALVPEMFDDRSRVRRRRVFLTTNDEYPRPRWLAECLDHLGHLSSAKQHRRHCHHTGDASAETQSDLEGPAAALRVAAQGERSRPPKAVCDLSHLAGGGLGVIPYRAVAGDALVGFRHRHLPFRPQHASEALSVDLEDLVAAMHAQVGRSARGPAYEQAARRRVPETPSILHLLDQATEGVMAPEEVEVVFGLEQPRRPPGTCFDRLSQGIDGGFGASAAGQEAHPPVRQSLPLIGEMGPVPFEKAEGGVVVALPVERDDLTLHRLVRSHFSWSASASAARAAKTSGASRMPSSSNWLSSTGAGASVRGSTPVWVFGKGMTSRIDVSSCSTITSRSMPKAKPPCGGVP